MSNVIHVDFRPKCATCNGSGEVLFEVSYRNPGKRTRQPEAHLSICTSCSGTGKPKRKTL